MSDTDKPNSGHDHDHDHDHDHGHGHDHDHGHGHDHDHGHGHDHDHGSGHDHDHDSGDDRSNEIEELIRLKQTKDEVDEPIVPSNDDANTQALSLALDKSFKIVKFLMVVMAVLFIFSGVFIVKSNEVAVILRLGKPVGDTPQQQVLRAGVYWSYPYPIDDVQRMPLGQSHTVESTIGWPAMTPDQVIKGDLPAGADALKPGVDGYTLTADGNIIHVKATMRYRVIDPVRYTFNFANTTNLIINALNNAVLYASANFKADDAIYKDKAGFTEAVYNRVSKLVSQSQFGIELEPINVETSAPLFVRPAFNSVQVEELDANRKMNEARGDADKIKNEAYGEAKAIVSAGYSSSNLWVQTIKAEADKFSTLLPYYEQNPNFFRQRLLAERMQIVLTNAQDKFFVPSREDGAKRELRLMLNREPEKPKPSR